MRIIDAQELSCYIWKLKTSYGRIIELRLLDHKVNQLYHFFIV